MRNARLDEAQLESWLPGEITVTSYVQMTPRLWKKWRKSKEPLDESERGEWKVGLKLNIQKTEIMASGPITLLQEGAESGLLSNTWKWIVQGDACADKARDFIGKGHPGGEQ